MGEIIPSVSSPAGDPLAGLDVLEPMPVSGGGASGASADAVIGAAPSEGADWLSPEGALRGEFGDLVEHVPQRPNAEAPVFPTPPAPWPSLSPSAAPVAAAGAQDDLDAGFEDVLASAPGASGAAAATVDDAPGSENELGAWTPETSDRATPVEATAVPGVHDVSSAESEVWADSYGAEADAIHGDAAPAVGAAGSEASPDGAGLEQPSDAASYLAAEWPEPPASESSAVTTPVVPGPAVLPGWDAAGRMTSGPVPPDPLLDAARQQEDDAFGWGRTPQETPAGGAGAVEGRAAGGAVGGSDEWMFEAAGTDSDHGGRPVVTPSSLAAAEALERVAAQLREGTLRADGFSPALGEAAALSAVLAALLGIDARWDVHR